MPRIIFKCHYIRPKKKKAASHLNNYVRYVATRDGVEKLTPDQAVLHATKKQQAMVDQLLRDFPQSRGMDEYEDYQSSPTRAAASEFITCALEDNYDQVAKKENYVSYIAQRPRAERIGSHGLFNGTDDTLELPRIAEEVANHPGNVWLPIISLRREDAARLGYDNAKRWRILLSSHAMDLAEAMQIPWDQFRWYAAFHDEGHHPHAHMICYSADGTSGFLSEEGIEKIKSMLAKEIFQQDLTELYQQQTQRRDELVRRSGEVMKELVRQMCSGTLENSRIDRLLDELAQRLKRTSGKKQYGYLKAPLKAVVDEIVDELAKDPRIASAYDLWYDLREEVLRTYKNDLPDRLPLSRQKEFKRIRNLVIEEAVRLGEYTEVFTPEDTQRLEQEQTSEDADSEDVPQNADIHEKANRAPLAAIRHDRRSQTAKYQAAKRILADTSSKPEQIIIQAVDWLTQAAESGLDDAQYALGKLYRDGGPVEQDTTRAAIWFSQAAEQGDQHAMYALGKILWETGDPAAALRWFRQSADLGNQYAQYVLGKMCLLGKNVLQDHEAAIHWFTLSAEQGNEHAQFFLDHMDDTPSLFASATRLLHHMGHIFQVQAPPPAGGLHFVDSKLRRRIWEKKIAMGHKPDDHEEPEIGLRST